MVDFSNPNLCGASPEMNDVFAKLESAADEIEAKIDEAASAAAAAFQTAQDEINNAVNKLQTIEIPELPKLNLQAEITNLTTLTEGSPEYVSALANITTEFGSSLTNAGLSLDSLVSNATSTALSGGNLCSVVPNFEKVAGSTEDATQKAEEVKQAAVAAITEVVSKVNQNAEITTQKEEIEVDVAAAQTPLKTGGDELLEDAGAYSMVPEEQVKTINTDAGETKVVTKKVEKVEERKNVAPKSKSDGFTHQTSTKQQLLKLADGEVTTDNQGFTYFTVELNHIPINGTLRITQFNLDPFQVKTYDTLRVGDDGERTTGYGERYGVHGEDLLWQGLGKRATTDTGKSADVSINGKEITIKTPYSIEDDHPGNLESFVHRKLRGTKPMFLGDMPGPKKGGRLQSNERLNKKFKGFLFRISYSYRLNYDPEPSV